ncbi:MAG TPA: hypothetical protein VFN91_07205 [Myxococcaceae bacterium]|nr:hypothetical protein [Myxococcaceae bacterium]
MRTSLLGVLLVLTGCGDMAPPECQMLPSAQGGYVLRFTRSAPASAGCDTATPQEFGDLWIFDTLANSQVRAHAAFSMPYPVNAPDPLPAGLVGAGKFTQRQADADGNCNVDSLTTMTNGALSYDLTKLVALGGAAYQNAEFKADVGFTTGACTAAYTVQALSPAVGCETDADCDPFKQPFSSGIFSVFDQSCKTDPWTSALAASLGTTGVCFFNKEYPSLK